MHISIAAIRVRTRLEMNALSAFAGPHSHIRLGAGSRERVTRSLTVTAHAESGRAALCDVDVCVFALQTTDDSKLEGSSRTGESICHYGMREYTI